MRKMLSDSILELMKCPNLKICTFTFMRFAVGALSEVLYNYYSNLFWTVLVHTKQSKKKGFPIAFSNLAWKGSGFF